MGCGEEEVETLSPIMIYVLLRLSNPFFQNYSWCVLKELFTNKSKKKKKLKITKDIATINIM